MPDKSTKTRRGFDLWDKAVRLKRYAFTLNKSEENEYSVKETECAFGAYVSRWELLQFTEEVQEEVNRLRAENIKLSTPKREVKCGDLLGGSKTTSCKGVEEWFDFPRYKVVAIHMYTDIMFLETLDPSGELIGHCKMDISSDQWCYFDEMELKDAR